VSEPVHKTIAADIRVLLPFLTGWKFVGRMSVSANIAFKDTEAFVDEERDAR
jgi:hypothetical protein